MNQNGSELSWTPRRLAGFTPVHYCKTPDYRMSVVSVVMNVYQPQVVSKKVSKATYNVTKQDLDSGYNGHLLTSKRAQRAMRVLPWFSGEI